jgi:hypothetical protein
VLAARVMSDLGNAAGANAYRHRGEQLAVELQRKAIRS